MSNRRRIPRAAPRSYADRLQRQPRGAAPRRRPAAPARGGLAWGTLAAVVAVAAEAGHLASAYVEWPQSTARGAYHVLAGALLGLVAAMAIAGAVRVRLATGAAVVIAVAGTAGWLAGALIGAAPYRAVPVPVAAATALAELGLVVVLLTIWKAAPPPRRT